MAQTVGVEADEPTPLPARTRKHMVVRGSRLPKVAVVTLAGLYESLSPFQIWNHDSLGALSVHETLIAELLTGTAVRLVGAAGSAVGVVAQPQADQGEFPCALTVRTWKHMDCAFVCDPDGPETFAGVDFVG